MKCYAKQRIVAKSDATQLTAYGILYARAILNAGVTEYKKPAVIKQVAMAVLREFNRLLQDEFFHNDDNILRAVIGYQEVMNELQLQDIVDYRAFRHHINIRDKKYQYMWETMCCILTICYYNIVDDFIKTEKKKIAVAQAITRYFQKECKNGLFNHANDGRKFAEWVCTSANYEVTI